MSATLFLSLGDTSLKKYFNPKLRDNLIKRKMENEKFNSNIDYKF